MPRRGQAEGDEKSQFLLPFEEIPRCSVCDKGRLAITSAAKDDKDSFDVDTSQKQAEREHFGACTLERTTDKLMPDGPTEKNHSGKFVIKIGQYVLLRPEENSLRPGVAKVISIFREKGKEGVALRVRWYYRAEDLIEGPREAVGEDEIFETEHFDDVDADSIAGRCRVMPYHEWIFLADAKRRSRTSLKDKYAQATQKDKMQAEAKAGNDSGRNDKSNRKENGDEMDIAIQGDEERAANLTIEDVEQLRDPSEKPDNSGKACNGEGADGVDRSRFAAGTLLIETGSDDDEIMSTFRENYPDSALLYYCRRFYDPLSNTFLVSKHECENADPTEELIALRAGRQGRNKQGDDEFHGEDMEQSSSDDEFEIDFSDDDPERKNGRRKRKRGRGEGQAVRRRQRATGASQFSLPQDIGIPSTLPCRDAQKAHVQEFLLSAINSSVEGAQGGSRCLYISGVPGTGKTATVREVIRDLTAKRSAGSLPPFEVVEVNAMSLPDPNLVYAELYAALAGNRNVSPMHAAQLLEKRFAVDTGSTGRKPKRARGGPQGRADSCTILILDEMDVLLARKQKVLYDMLEWPTRKNARMAVIGIANTMDLPERILPRLGSRLGVNRLSYPPYTSSQLQTILDMTLDQSRVQFAPPAIQLCVKKVGSVSGDVRRALELCRRASELLVDTLETDDDRVEAEKPMVKAEHMQAAIHDIAGGARLVALNQLSTFERIVLGSAISLARRQGSSAVEKTCSMAAVTSEAVHMTRLKKLVDEVDTPSIQELEEACWRLAASRIVILEATAVPRNSRIIVNVSTDDCLFALRDCELMKALLQVS